jgi:hypothetical protein
MFGVFHLSWGVKIRRPCDRTPPHKFSWFSPALKQIINGFQDQNCYCMFPIKCSQFQFIKINLLALMPPISGYQILILKLTRNQNSEALVSKHYLHHLHLFILTQLVSKGEVDETWRPNKDILPFTLLNKYVSRLLLLSLSFTLKLHLTSFFVSFLASFQGF